MDSIERQYRYGAKWSVIVGCGGLFAFCAAVIEWTARTNDRGLIINGIIELEPDSATIFYWVLFAFSVGFVLVAILLGYQRVAFRQRIAFDTSELIAPKSRWSKDEQRIAYREIRSVIRSRVGKVQTLSVEHAGGRVTISSALLPTRTAIAEIHQLLKSKTESTPAGP